MAVYIKELNIGHFRGIHNLKVDKLNHINLVVGDNNSGKTSVLEAIMLLRNPADFTNVLRVARLRETIALSNGVSIYESFVNLFPQDMPHKEMEIHALCRDQPVKFRLSGTQKRIMLEQDELVKKAGYFVAETSTYRYNSDRAEVDAFVGEMSYDVEGRKGSNLVEINAYTSISGREIKKNNYLKMIYLAPADHVGGNVFNRILRNDAYKEICLRVLQLFDPEIIDLLILKNENNNNPVEYIKHETLGNMPLSTYGDGIKKVLALANAIVQAAGGVLMIDEVETAIHAKYYDEVFRFVVKACKQFDVQVFITTHSAEAIDGLLGTQDYAAQNESDDISVVTFRRDTAEKRTYSRVLSGKHVYSNREQFGFEVRL